MKMKIFNGSPDAVHDWKRRPGRTPNNKTTYRESLSKKRESYIFQLDKLQECLSRLKRDAESKVFHYLKVEAFIPPEEVGVDYIDWLSDNFGLRFVSKEHFIAGSILYFYIENISLLINALSEAISELSLYIAEDISKGNFTNKRIVLWQKFELSTNETKNYVFSSPKHSSKVRLRIEWIEQIGDEEERLIQSAKECGIEIDIYGNGIVDLSDLRKVGGNSELKIDQFVKLISNYDQIKMVSLDEFMCKVEDLSRGLKDVEALKIKQLPVSAPIVAVIDSGVSKNSLTAGALTLDGLDFTASNPKDGNPFKDELDHGTGVAGQIIYGLKNLNDYFFSQKADSLVPLFRIFPVKIFGSEQEGNVDYPEIFAEDGPLVEYIKKYHIKFINLSFGSINPKTHTEDWISTAGCLLDKFSKKYDVLFIIASGNIYQDDFVELIQKDPSLAFFQRKKELAFLDTAFNKINIGSPADALNSVTVGSCYPQQDRLVASTFSKSFSLSTPGYVSKPEVLAHGGGDIPILMSTPTPKLDYTSNRTCLISSDPRFLRLDVGTSFSAPSVTRAMAVGSLLYPDVKTQVLKNIFLHKISGSAYKVHDLKQSIVADGQKKKSIRFHSSFCGNGGMNHQDEDVFFQDDESELSVVIEGKVQDAKIFTYLIPIREMLDDLRIPEDHKILFRISINHYCSNTEPAQARMPLVKSNKFHIAAMVHHSDMDPTEDIEQENSNGKTITYENRVVSNTSSNAHRMILKWTSDYQQKYLPNFSQESASIPYSDFINSLDGSKFIKVSVRGLQKNIDIPDSEEFSLVFSIEDGGAANITRAKAEIDI